MSIDKIQQGDTLTQSKDLVADNIEKLKQLFPEIVTEGKIDFKVLQDVLGEDIEEEDEYYRFTWAGKAQARREAHKPSTGTLRPAKEDSVDWDTTENLYIEGDNLEVLKLLQKSYAGKVKMIYIDPPYNTGKDFVYKDNYKDNLKNYQEVTGQVDSDGNKLSTNSDSDGRFHSNWLNMMYPRLRLARNLLSDDGIIFASIDDNEVHNLNKAMEEVFGESNFVVQVAWRKSDNQANIGQIARVKEYILGYAKKKDDLTMFKMPLTDKAKKEYRYSDNIGQFRRAILLHKTRGRHFFDVKTKSGNILKGPWMINEEDFKKLDSEDAIYWTSGGEEQPYGKIYLHKSKGQIPNDFWGIEFGTNQRASSEIEELFGKRVFDFPKPTSMLANLIKIGADKESIILDFFAGSSSSAQAVMNLNSQDEGKRKFIQVQLPEKTNPKSEAFKNNYQVITEVAKERIRRAAQKIAEENPEKAKDLDLGFKVFKLDSSNIKGWDGNPEELETNLWDAVSNIKKDRTEEDVLYEILLKYGLDLTLPIEEKVIEGKTVFNVGFGALFICLGDNLTSKVAEGIGQWKEELAPEMCRVIFKDTGFTDVEKTNSVQTLKRFGITEIKSI
ncbi:site-specific DNA-methyltransferase [Cellulophaga sp. 20_2_10]|uniref:site-specific DNA-methyltransferase n=1 Tax=Cellulophaga sp. 20_2_10 TaxID=2942476 RepID=UPI00201AE1DE|nr:site-specific DNA-methyltransferase [Cellulophaga sp. 20_2_10]MCL5246846.1 site-specific DNA-methyltransferase [Cellulophaga sp. 20_2_10]